MSTISNATVIHSCKFGQYDENLQAEVVEHTFRLVDAGGYHLFDLEVSTLADAGQTIAQLQSKAASELAASLRLLASRLEIG